MAETTTITNNLNFKFGNSTKLPPTISNGTIYVTTDEKSMYVDLDNIRMKLGDVVFYETLDELKGDKANWCKNTLGYVSDTNTLACWTGTKWQQINDVSALNTAISGLRTDLTAETAHRTAAVSAVDTKITNETARATAEEAAIKARVKATEDAIGTKSATNTATSIWSAIETLSGDSTTSLDALEQKINTEISDRQAADNALSGKITENKNAIDAINNTTSGILATAKAYTDSEVSTAKTTLTGATTAASSEINLYGVKAYATEKANAALASAQADATTKANTAKADAISTAASDATTKANTAKTEAISAAAADATSKANTAESNAKGYTDSQISALSNTVTAADTALSNRIAKFETFIEGAGFDVTTGETTSNVIDTLLEIQDYIASDETAAAGMLESIGVLNDQLDGFDDTKTAVKTYIDNKVSGLNIGNYALKTELNAVNNTVTENKNAIDAINHTETGILATAKGYTDSKVSDAKTALTGTDSDASDANTIKGAKAYATAKANAALASAQADATTKANAAQSNAISAAASDATTKANTAETNAISAAASDATTKANTAETNAKSYTNTKLPKIAAGEANKGFKIVSNETTPTTYGTVSFVPAASNESLSISTTTSGTSSTVTFGMVWGRFE